MRIRFQRLKLNCHKPLSSFGFSFNLRHHSLEAQSADLSRQVALLLHEVTEIKVRRCRLTLRN